MLFIDNNTMNITTLIVSLYVLAHIATLLPVLRLSNANPLHSLPVHFTFEV